MQGQQNQPKLKLGLSKKKTPKFPLVPEKLYFTIGEVGQLCFLKAHVLRYWEQEFHELAPSKRCGNRRYYSRDDVILIRKIRALLYEKGFTIDGARIKLKEDACCDDMENELMPSDIIQEAIAKLKKVADDLEDEL